MCVRYTLHESDAAISTIGRALSREFLPLEWGPPRYNITLTHVVPVVAAAENGPELRRMMWGLVPFYERDKPQKRMLPNATAEKAVTSPAFRSATAKRRCLVPANGFYEWQTVGRLKFPHLFTLRNEEPFAFAGIWDPSPDDSLPPAFAILTTVPNALVESIHTRMPVILTAETMPRWIGSEPLAPEEYSELTRPLDPDLMQERPVSRFVNSSRNEGPQCHAAPEVTSSEPELDLS